MVVIHCKSVIDLCVEAHRYQTRIEREGDQIPTKEATPQNPRLPLPGKAHKPHGTPETAPTTPATLAQPAHQTTSKDFLTSPPPVSPPPTTPTRRQHELFLQSHHTAKIPHGALCPIYARMHIGTCAVRHRLSWTWSPINCFVVHGPVFCMPLPGIVESKSRCLDFWRGTFVTQADSSIGKLSQCSKVNTETKAPSCNHEYCM